MTHHIKTTKEISECQRLNPHALPPDLKMKTD